MNVQSVSISAVVTVLSLASLHAIKASVQFVTAGQRIAQAVLAPQLKRSAYAFASADGHTRSTA